MLYLLDANVIIDAHRNYYPMGRVPEFWDWLEHQATLGLVRIPLEIFDEIDDGTDEVSEWACQARIREQFLLQEEPDPEIVRSVLSNGYAPDLSDLEVEQLGRDPFLIAYCLADRDSRCIVTTEVSRPSKLRANRKVPDVALALGGTSCDTFALLRRLDFRTSWRSGA